MRNFRQIFSRPY